MILLYKTRDLYLRKVYNDKNKLVGIVEDIYVDLQKGRVLGIKVSERKLFFKNNFININKLIIDNEKIIAANFEEKKGVEFKNIKDIEVFDEEENLKGVIEDIFIDDDFNIKGFIVSSGIINNITKGKEIFLPAECEYKDNIVIYKGRNKILLTTILHELRENYEG